MKSLPVSQAQYKDKKKPHNKFLGILNKKTTRTANQRKKKKPNL